MKRFFYLMLVVLIALSPASYAHEESGSISTATPAEPSISTPAEPEASTPVEPEEPTPEEPEVSTPVEPEEPTPEEPEVSTPVEPGDSTPAEPTPSEPTPSEPTPEEPECTEHSYGYGEYSNSDIHILTCINCGHKTEAAHTKNENNVCTGCGILVPYCDICGNDMEYAYPIVAEVNGVTMHIWGCEHGKWDSRCDMHELVRDLSYGESCGEEGHKVCCSVCWGWADIVPHESDESGICSLCGYGSYCDICGVNVGHILLIEEIDGVTMHIWGCEHGLWNEASNMHEEIVDPDLRISHGENGHFTMCKICGVNLESEAHHGAVRYEDTGINDTENFGAFVGHCLVCDFCVVGIGGSNGTPILPHTYAANGVCTACGNTNGPVTEEPTPVPTPVPTPRPTPTPEPVCDPHLFAEEIVSQASCDLNGLKMIYCEVCSYIEGYEQIPALGCTYTNAVSLGVGAHKYMCANGCGNDMVEACAYENNTCTACGYLKMVTIQLPIEKATVTTIEEASIAPAANEDSLGAEELIVPEGAVLVVDQLDFEEPVQIITEVLAAIPVEAQKVINVAIKVGEETVQPAGAVTISLRITEEEAVAFEGMILLLIGEDGLLYEVPYEIIDGQLVFTCDVLGAFIVADPIQAEGQYVAFAPVE